MYLLNKKLGFTMIELIIVIAIITFLAVTTMVILTKFVGNSRDTRRVADVAQIMKGMETYYMENQNTYPMPDSDPVYGISTGTVNGVAVNYKGDVLDTVAKSINMAKAPKDPSNSLQGYTYGITSDKRFYQISYVLENPNRFSLNFNLDKLFANGSGYSSGGRGQDFVTLNLFQGLFGNSVSAAGEKSKVEGNYKKVMVVNITGVYYAINAPSLVYANTGTVDLLSSTTYYVVDKNDNLPYPVGGGAITLAQKEDGNISLSEASAAGASLTAINITSYFTSGVLLSTLISGAILTTFGGSTVLNNTSQAVGGGVTVASVSTGGGGASIITGVCGTDNGTSLSVLPTNLCSTGTASAVTTNTSNYTWSCNGSNGGATASCSASRILISQSDCTGAGWEWVPSAQDMLIGSTVGSGYCISPTINFGSTNNGLDGISFNGRGNNSDTRYQGWDTESYAGTRDSGLTSYFVYGQTRTLTSPSGYTCEPIGSATKGYRNASGVDNGVGEDTLVNRMRYLQNYKTTQAKMQYTGINWVDFGATNPVNNHAIPTMFLSDCLDGTKDLGNDIVYKHSDNSTQTITYSQYTGNVTSFGANESSLNLSDTTYQNRQKYLLGRTQKSGSHVPSAYSSISAGSAGTGIGEYEKACSYADGTPGSIAGTNDNVSERIWLASIGSTDGSFRGGNFRVVGYSGCSSQNNGNSGCRDGSTSARLVVRP